MLLSPLQRLLGRGRALTLLLLSWASVGCGDLELPEPPDMSMLVEAYSNPTGELNQGTAVDLGNELVAIYEDRRDFSPQNLLSQIVGDIEDVGGGEIGDGAEGDGAGEQRINGNVIDVAAIAEIHRICDGWGDAVIDEGANGALDLTATLDNGGMIPVVWGTFSHCKVQRQDIRLELDGDLRIRFGTTEPRVGLRYLTRLSYLVSYEGDVVAERGTESTQFALSSHFQVFADGRVRMLVVLVGASFVTEVDVAALDPSYGSPMLDVGLLTASDAYRCSIDLSTAHGSCAVINDPESVVSW